MSITLMQLPQGIYLVQFIGDPVSKQSPRGIEFRVHVVKVLQSNLEFLNGQTFEYVEGMQRVGAREHDYSFEEYPRQFKYLFTQFNKTSSITNKSHDFAAFQVYQEKQPEPDTRPDGPGDIHITVEQWAAVRRAGWGHLTTSDLAEILKAVSK